MNNKLRLRKYVHRNTVISQEGLWDVFQSLFTGVREGDFSKAGAPNPKNRHGKNWRQVADWVKRYHNEITKTFGNRQWVENNITDEVISSKTMPYRLSFKGKVAKNPVEILTEAETVATQWVKEKSPKLAQYLKTFDTVYDEMVAKVKTAKTPAEQTRIIKAAEVEVNNIPLPIPDGETCPEFLAGDHWVTEKGGNWGRMRKVRKLELEPGLPVLTVDDIVKGTQLILRQLSTIDSLMKSIYEDKQTRLQESFWSNLDGRFWFHAETPFLDRPGFQERAVSEYLTLWYRAIADCLTWMYASCTENHGISLESGVGQNRFAQYFDATTDAADSDQRAALFGTVESGWRAILEDKLDCAVFNPVVANWDKEAQAQEELVKKTASALVFCITPKQTGFYSFVELTSIAIREPERLFACFLDNDEGTTWPEKQQASMDAIKTYLKNECGITVYETLDALAEAINAEVEPISEDGTVKDAND